MKIHNLLLKEATLIPREFTDVLLIFKIKFPVSLTCSLP